MARKPNGKAAPARVITFANQKGGVAKSTTAEAFAASLTARGYAVLTVDMDAQPGNSTSADLTCDGEYHTLRIPVSSLKIWKGQLNVIRFDFFKSALDGDCMDIRSISLVK